MILVDWQQFKALIDSNQIRFKEVADDGGYLLLGYDGNFEVECRMYESTPNWQYKSEYESSYQSLVTTVMDPRDSDTGAPATSPKYAPTGWYQKVHEFEFTTAKLNSLEDEKLDLTPYNYGIMKFYDAAGTELTTQIDIDNSCVKTVVDWTAIHDIMVMSGAVKQAVKPSTRVKVWGVGAPGIPAAFGGTQVFVDGVNMEFVEPGNEVGIKGLVGKILPHDSLGGDQYTNTIRFQVWTPDSPGIQHRIQVKIDVFIPPGE